MSKYHFTDGSFFNYEEKKCVIWSACSALTLSWRAHFHMCQAFLRKIALHKGMCTCVCVYTRWQL